MPNILPQFGRPFDVKEPPGVEHLYPDPQESSLSVRLLVLKPAGLIPQDRHWAITWQVGIASSNDPVYRVLGLVRERGSTGLLTHLTNWGPKTKIAGLRTQGGVFYHLATLTYTQRQALERIGAEEVVYEPDGKWSCQSWVASVLNKGVRAGLFRQDVVNAAIEEAMKP
jgi:hypothetical protein